MFKVKNMSKTSAQIQVSVSTCDLGIPLVGEGVSPTCLFGDIKNCTRSPAKPAKMSSLQVPGMMGMTRLEAEITPLSLSLSIPTHISYRAAVLSVSNLPWDP